MAEKITSLFKKINDIQCNVQDKKQQQETINFHS